MNCNLQLVLNLDLESAQAVLGLLNTLSAKALNIGHVAPTESRPHPEGGVKKNYFDPLRAMLDDRLLRVVNFAVLHEGRFFNDELAKTLEIDDPLTSLVLGQLTKKLKKTGVRAEGHTSGYGNWYTKRRVGGRTELVVRPDVLDIFKTAAEVGA